MNWLSLASLSRFLAFTLAIAVHPAKAGSDGDKPRPIKIVLVTLFEMGEETDDAPGEFQFWVERFPLDKTFPMPTAFRDLRYNNKGILGLVTGIGTAKSSASIMALGMDPRFDLRKAYWLVAGIAGFDPNDASLGSAAWAEWLIDGDLAHQIDMREAPEDWLTGYFPLHTAKPYPRPRPKESEGVAFRLKPSLVEWAYQLTKDTSLEDTDDLKQLREPFIHYPNARKPPFVLKGDNMAAMTFWHGKLLNIWANDWSKYWSDDKANFVSSSMEDTGIYTALMLLHHSGKVDLNRLLVLRTASNFTIQAPGLTAAESLSGEKKNAYSAFLPALEAAYRVGRQVVDELIENWDKYGNEIPGEQENQLSDF